MTSKLVVLVPILLAGLLSQVASAQTESWISDRKLAAELIENGVAVETDRATVWFEAGVLEPDARSAFAELVDRGIRDIQAYLGVSPANHRKIRYFVSGQVEISHSTWRSVYLPMSKVQNRTAPYLHETAHVVAPCDECPMWFGEGLASFVQSYVSEHVGGYDGGIFSRRGNRGIDQDARRWLASERGQAVLPYIGIPGEPPAISYDRSNVAAPFYVMAQSFVKFLVEHVTIEKLQGMFEAKDLSAVVQTSTGQSLAEWKEQWLKELAR